MSGEEETKFALNREYLMSSCRLSRYLKMLLGVRRRYGRQLAVPFKMSNLLLAIEFCIQDILSGPVHQSSLGNNDIHSVEPTQEVRMSWRQRLWWWRRQTWYDWDSDWMSMRDTAESILDWCFPTSCTDAPGCLRCASVRQKCIHLLVCRWSIKAGIHTKDRQSIGA